MALKYIYYELYKNEHTRTLAREWYEECKDGYHPVTQMTVEGVLRAE